jgi:hypothetical protein
MTAAGTYIIPTIDVLFSGTFQSQPGVPTFVPGGNWLVPTSVLTARTAKITVQYDFSWQGPMIPGRLLKNAAG